MKTILLVSALALALGGCGLIPKDPPPVVLGHCELPANDDQDAEHVKSTTPGQSLDAQHAQWAEDRGIAERNAASKDRIRQYVHEKCN